ncbi:MAG: tetratricopeptide repeat protein [Bryobacteraceae bacterium]
MTRLLLFVLMTLNSPIAFSEEKPRPVVVQEPPEEDQSMVEQEYAFNPLQAEKEIKVGKFYFRKGSYKAAARRFEEALKWNPSFAEAYMLLGDAQLKLKNKEAAKEAYKKFLELEPEHKDADDIRKKLEKNL